MSKELEIKFRKIIKGNLTIQSNNVAFSMLLTRLAQMYKMSPTQQTLNYGIREIDAFLTKYKLFMKAEIQKIEQIECFED